MGTSFLNVEKKQLESTNCQFNNNVAHTKPKYKDKSESKPRKCQCGVVPLIVSGLVLLTLGLLSIKFTFTDIILRERLKMVPGYPPYELWLNPKPEIRLNVYIFTVENAKEFMSGTDSKIKLKELGPIAYREYLQHQDVVFHENSTLSYTPIRRAEFLPHANRPGILNETIIVPNFALLAAASFTNEYNYLMKVGYNYIHRKYNNGLFINVTIYDYLWNLKNKVLQKLNDIVPSMVPTVNSGILHGIYAADADRYNVKIGTKYGNSEFFHINTVNGVPTVPGYNVKKGDCFASIENSTEGAMYTQRIAKSSVLTFWRKAICRTVDLHFEKEVEIDDVLTYKYTLAPDMYDRKPKNETDCYGGTYVELPNGLTDVSKCYFNLPFAASLPHFYGRYEEITKKFEGLKPDAEKHSCFTIVEPKMGVPLNQAARSQMNLVIPKLSSVFENDYQMFSDMILPLFWVEYIQNDLTPEIHSVISFFVNVLPIIEVLLTFILLFVGFGLIFVAFVKLFHSRWANLTKNFQINFQSTERRRGIF